MLLLDEKVTPAFKSLNIREMIIVWFVDSVSLCSGIDY